MSNLSVCKANIKADVILRGILRINRRQGGYFSGLLLLSQVWLSPRSKSGW